MDFYFFLFFKLAKPEKRIKCTLIPGDGVGPELVYSVQEVFKVNYFPFGYFYVMTLSYCYYYLGCKCSCGF